MFRPEVTVRRRYIIAGVLLMLVVAASAQAAGRREPGALIDPQDAYRMVRNGRAILVDVRDHASYREAHAAGAILVPLHEVGAAAEQLGARGLTIITYCQCPAEETSMAAALQLIARGVDDVLVLRGGIRGWMLAGLPMRSGDRS